jgi:hypothetical protein
MAKLVVARYGAAGVVIQRIDWTGRSAGLTAVYTGQIHGNRIVGDVTWSWYGHWKQPAAGTWSATLAGGEARPFARAPGPALPGTPHSRERLSPTMPKPTAATRAFKVDLSGDWGGYFDSPGFFDLIRISQQGSDLSAEKLTDDRTPTGRLLFRGAYDPPAETGHVQLADYDSAHWPNPAQWLVAEEVYPGLVQFDAEGRPATVRYHFVNAMLLNEVQKQHRTIAEQAAQISDLEAQLADERAKANAQDARLKRLEAILLSHAEPSTVP